MKRILFMGTPEFACEQLRALWDARPSHNWDVVGALCQPDKPKGRGYQLIPPPVKEYAEGVGIPVYQPDTLKNGAFDETLSALKPDLIVVAAYGKILPKAVLDLPEYGCINVHGSLLPAYRGAAPIQRAMMDGLTETGISIQYMAEGLDTGDVIAKCVVPIDENEDFGTLYADMGKAGAELLLSAVDSIFAGTAVREPQNDADSNYARKIEKEECALDFSMPARTLHNMIRALSPAPLGFASLETEKETKTVKFVSSVVVSEEKTDAEPGTVLSADGKKGVFTVACGTGIIGITALVPEGKGRMSAGDFIRGRKIAAGDRFFKN